MKFKIFTPEEASNDVSRMVNAIGHGYTEEDEALIKLVKERTANPNLVKVDIEDL